MSQIFHDERQLISPLCTQDTEVSANPFSTYVHQQAAARGSQQQPASSGTNPWQMLNVGICGKLQQSGGSSVVRSCGKLQQSVDSNFEKPLMKGKRGCEFGSVSSSEQERFLSERDKTFMITTSDFIITSSCFFLRW